MAAIKNADELSVQLDAAKKLQGEELEKVRAPLT